MNWTTLKISRCSCDWVGLNATGRDSGRWCVLFVSLEGLESRRVEAVAGIDSCESSEPRATAAG